MEVPTIEMSVEDAQEKLAAYESALRRVDDEEMAAAVEGYRALAEGTKLVDVEQVIRSCARDGDGRPLLAIARADRFQVKLLWPSRSERCHFCTAVNWVFEWPGLVRSVEMGETHNYRAYPVWAPATLTPMDLEGFALIPMVPPDVLASRSYLRDHYVLWEVDEWASTPQGAEPDRDPYLLRFIGGTLYAVVGEWELTDLERAIMRGRQ
ncbi:hypothetical protein LCGC14_2013770, partial [marine sediment metagenome]